MSAIDALHDDPRDQDRDGMIWMVEELQGRLLDTHRDQAVEETGRLARAFGLSPQTARMLRVLSNGRTISRLSLATRCVSTPLELLADEAGYPKVVNVQLSKTRKMIRPHGLDIVSAHLVGVYCPPETAKVLRAVMAGHPLLPNNTKRAESADMER